MGWIRKAGRVTIRLPSTEVMERGLLGRELVQMIKQLKPHTFCPFCWHCVLTCFLLSEVPELVNVAALIIIRAQQPATAFQDNFSVIQNGYSGRSPARGNGTY
ncbi:unnamed protein product [Ostreobium quekettii]|uniref:Uncharacterized protein n=1 Tax=Ostreobium quekettii TaxID=121088 RepID=A0A8S1JAY2_9CHLO|nr:unnamed protein product [Ostreobium quekettii]